MRVIVDESHVKIRTRLGELAPFLGLLVLAVATLFVFLKPALGWATLILIWIGFIISLVGGYLGVRYVGPTAHHKRVPEALKGLGQRYVLLMYTTPVPFVLVDPGGVTTITVKSHGGHIIYREGTWRHQERMGWLRRLAGQEGLGRPYRAAASDAEEMRRWLEKRYPELAEEVPVRSVVLFVNPDIILEAEDPPVPTFRMAELKHWLRRDGRRTRLPEATWSRLVEVLEGKASA
jgi:hypothetical protein